MAFKKMYLLLMLMPVLIFGQSQPKVLKLEECIDIARQNNPDFRLKEMDIKKAEANLKLAKSSRMPKLNFDANYNRVSEAVKAQIGGLSLEVPYFPEPVKVPDIEFQLGSQDNYSLKLGVTQPLFTGFRISNMIQAGEKQLQSEIYDLKAELNSLIFNVKSAYFSLIKAYKMKEIAEASKQLVQAHLNDVKNLYEQGMIPRNEVLKIEIKVSEVELNISRADHAIQLATFNLLNLMGMQSSDQILPDLETEFSIQETDAVAVGTSESHQRPELSVLAASAEAAQKYIEGNKAAYYPQLSLVGFYEYGKPAINAFKNEWMDYWAVGINMKWNLLDWGARKSQIATARIQRDQIIETQNKVKRLIQSDVKKSVLKKDEAKKNLKITLKKEQQAAENLRLVKDQFKQGMVTNTDFLDAETQLTQSRIDKIQAIIDYRIAVADLNRALGKANE